MRQSSLLSFFPTPTISLRQINQSSPTATEIQLAQTSTGSKPSNATSTSVITGDKGPAEVPHSQIHERLNSHNVTTKSNAFNIIISRIDVLHLPALKCITSSLLAVKYPDAFYTEVVHDPILAELSRVAVCNSKPIGWMRCRLEPELDPLQSTITSQRHNQIYIVALCLVAPHRGRGIASMLLDSICQSEVADHYQVTSVYAHVWESNEDALEWYEKRGFKRVVLLERYYRKLRPPGAWIMRKELKRHPLIIS